MADRLAYSCRPHAFALLENWSVKTCFMVLPDPATSTVPPMGGPGLDMELELQVSSMDDPRGRNDEALGRRDVEPEQWWT